VVIPAVGSTTTVRELKSMITKKTGIKASHFRLGHRQYALQDDRTVASYGIGQDASVHMLARLKGGAPPLHPTGGITPFGGRVEAAAPIVCAGRCAQTYDNGVLCQPFRNGQSRVDQAEGWAYMCDHCATAAGFGDRYRTQPDPWPQEWDGMPTAGTMTALYPFPCLAPACRAQKVWHDRGPRGPGGGVA
jgi:hypothetical protein